MLSADTPFQEPTSLMGRADKFTFFALDGGVLLRKSGLVLWNL